MSRTCKVDKTDLEESINHVEKKLKSIILELSDLTKSVRELKKIAKIKQPKREIEYQLSPKLAKFLGRPIASRAHVLRSVSTYVMARNLQIKDNKNKFKVDTQLSLLLDIKEGTILTFLSLNKYVTPLICTYKRS